MWKGEAVAAAGMLTIQVIEAIFYESTVQDTKRYQAIPMMARDVESRFG